MPSVRATLLYKLPLKGCGQTRQQVPLKCEVNNSCSCLKYKLKHFSYCSSYKSHIFVCGILVFFIKFVSPTFKTKRLG